MARLSTCTIIPTQSANVYANSTRARSRSLSLSQVFDASLLENQEEGSNNGDGNGDTSPRSIASAQSPHVSSPVSTQAFKLSQLDPMKLKMENTQLKKLIRRYKVRASLCDCMRVGGARSHQIVCLEAWNNLFSFLLVHHCRIEL